MMSITDIESYDIGYLICCKYALHHLAFGLYCNCCA